MQVTPDCLGFNKVYAVCILDQIESKGPGLGDYKVLREYVGVFLDEVPTLPRKREIDFTIDLMP